MLRVGTCEARARLAVIDAPSASNPLEQEYSSVDTYLPKQSNTGGTAKRRPTRVPALRTIDAPSASNPLGQEYSSVDAHLTKQPNTGRAAKGRPSRETVRTANASLPVGRKFCISDRGMNMSIPVSTVSREGKGDEYRRTHPTPRVRINPTNLSGETVILPPIPARPSPTTQLHQLEGPEPSARVAEVVITTNSQSSSSQANSAHNLTKFQNQPIVTTPQQLLILHGGSEAELPEQFNSASQHPLAALEKELQTTASSHLLNLVNFGSVSIPLNTLPILDQIPSAGPSESSAIELLIPIDPHESALPSHQIEVLSDQALPVSARLAEHRRKSTLIPDSDKIFSAGQMECSAFDQNVSLEPSGSALPPPEQKFCLINSCLIPPNQTNIGGILCKLRFLTELPPLANLSAPPSIRMYKQDCQRVLSLPDEWKFCLSRFWLIPPGRRNIDQFLYKNYT